MSSVFEKPLADVPVNQRATVQPYLRMAETIGRQNAEAISTYMPLPWSEMQGAEIIAIAVNGLTEILGREAPTLADYIVLAMQRAMVGALVDRLDELFEASAGRSRGGRA